MSDSESSMLLSSDEESENMFAGATARVKASAAAKQEEELEGNNDAEEAERIAREKEEADRLAAEEAARKEEEARREAEAEAQRQREAEEQRQRDAEAQAQMEKEEEEQRQREEAEAEAQREKDAEAQRQREEAEQREREAEAEAERQKALERAAAAQAAMKADDSDSDILSDDDDEEELEAQRVEEQRKAEEDRLAQEQAEKEEAERAEAERIAAEKAEAERIAAEQAEADRIAAEKAEADRIAAEQAEAERIAAEKAEADRIAAEKAEAARAQQALDALRKVEENKEEEGDDGEEEEEDLQSLQVNDAGRRQRKGSSMIDDHHLNYKAMLDAEAEEKRKAEILHQKGTTAHLLGREDAASAYEKSEAKKALAKKKSMVADIKFEHTDGEKRLTQLKNARKRGKKKSWKPKIYGYVTLAPGLKMKKAREHKVSSDGHFVAIDRLPSSCNIDENEAEWTKNKKTDVLCPTLVIFNSQSKYDEFCSKVKGKSMRAASGLMLLAQYAMGIVHFREFTAVGPDIASAIGTLKSEMLRTDAVLPVDSFRGSDLGEDGQVTIVDRNKSVQFICEEEQIGEWYEAFNTWMNSYAESAQSPVFS